jgi:hypothetical protein
MGIFQTRNPTFNSSQWMPGNYTTTSVSVTNTAAGVELVPAVASPTAPRFCFITNDASGANAAAIHVLVGTGSGTTPTQPSATNSTFTIDPGLSLEIQVWGDRVAAISSTANAQTAKVAIANGVKA